MSVTAILAALSRVILGMICSAVMTSPSLAQIPEFSGGKLPTLAPLVREIMPSVVNIAIQGREELEYDVQAIGSGVIVDAQNAYVLTANHVVAQVSTVQVTTKDGAGSPPSWSAATPAPTSPSCGCKELSPSRPSPWATATTWKSVTS